MKTNQFKTTPHPKVIIPEGHNYKPQKLNPPVFDIDLKTDIRKGIWMTQAIERGESRRY